MKYMVWADGYYEREIVAGEPEYAAEKYVEARHADFDYPEEMEVNVKDEAGLVEKYVVVVEMSPIFSASKIDQSKD